MIIKRLTIDRFGVYAGQNLFAFSNRRPIVLIGGMNGHGKTTFLAAILLALYGENSAAYRESSYRSYRSYLRAYVNRNDGNTSAAVELEFQMNESTNYTYRIRRAWTAAAKGCDETVSVWENGTYSDFLTKNWAMFVETILPSALARFFFFDGEKIAELATDANHAQMKESIRSMLGIGVLDVLKGDLARILRRIARTPKTGDDRAELDELQRKKEQLRARLDEMAAQIERMQAEMRAQEARIDEIHRSYTMRGGDVLAARDTLMQRRAALAAEREQTQNALLDCAAGELPLVLVQDLVREIKMQAEDEHNDLVMTEALDRIEAMLSYYAAHHGGAQEANADFLAYVREAALGEATAPFYRISDHALFQLNDLLEHLLADSAAQVRRLTAEKAQLGRQIDELDRQLALDIDEQALSALSEELRAAEAALAQLKVDCATKEQDRSAAEAELTAARAAYSRAVEAYVQDAELNDDHARMEKYAHMALHIAEEYMTMLQARKMGLLGTTITACYKELTNKKNLIDRIVMDGVSLDLTYFDAQDNEVPKDALSAGEKQLMVIAILWALAICSKKKLPVIIDTPLARLDSVHRMALVTRYFPRAGDQTIILSTDAEIDAQCYTQMKDAIGDEYTLCYDEKTKSTAILKGYFQKYADETSAAVQSGKGSARAPQDEDGH